MNWKFTLTWSAVIAAFTACDNEPGRLGVVYNTIDNNYGVVLVDTIKVAASTVLLDSIPTSGTGSILIGGYSDPKLGVLSAEGYIQVGNGDTWDPADNAIYDSLVLVMNYSGYHYGDTSNAHTFIACRIITPFKTYSLPQFWVDEKQYSALYQASSLYNSSTIRYDVSVLGGKTVRPRPNSDDSLTIRLDDGLGREWLNLAKNESATITQLDKFIEYFNGFSIAVRSVPEAVIGFTAEDIKVRLYYREYADEKLVQKVHEFPFTTNLSYYTKISADRAGTTLEYLNNENDELSATETEEEVFIQAGTGVVAKVTFPYIRKMIDLDDLLIVNEAKLILEPVNDSYDETFSVPRNLTLFETDKSNIPLTQIYADYNVTEVQKASISIDQEFDKTSGYVFTITQYMQNLLSTEGNLQRGLLITPMSDEINKSVERVYLNAGSGSAYRIKLKIWYTQKK
jgi:hypothetical protein